MEISIPMYIRDEQEKTQILFIAGFVYEEQEQEKLQLQTPEVFISFSSSSFPSLPPTEVSKSDVATTCTVYCPSDIQNVCSPASLCL